jgi:hypothetical protein
MGEPYIFKLIDGNNDMRRPIQNYFGMGFKAGDRLIFERLQDEDVRIASDRYLTWRGTEIALTPLRVKFGEMLGIKSEYPTSDITNEQGKRLDEIYDETYGATSDPE